MTAGVDQEDHVMGNRIRRACLAVLLAGTCFAAAACNTVEGLGKDIKAGGQAIENAAD
ncbi:MAG: hypothetical protein Kow0022_13570 [Phycisphaerales bacterium]